MRPVEERFWPKVRRGIACWVWTAGKNNGGYGAIISDSGPLLAHRVSWQMHFGDIPEGLHVCHKCDNPACVNPEHLFLGTHQDNMRDMHSKARGGRKQPKGESHFNSKLSVSDIRLIRACGEGSYVAARMFGVTPSTIRKIRRGDSWGHVV